MIEWGLLVIAVLAGATALGLELRRGERLKEYERKLDEFAREVRGDAKR